MKKFFSLIALVAVFAACQPEKVQTAFTVAGATATINVQVFNVNTGAAYGGTYTLSASEGTVSGGTVAIESAQSTGISKHDVTLTVTGPKLAKTYTYAVTIPDVLAGGHADVNAIIVVGEDGDTYDYEVVESATEEVTEVAMVNDHYPTHTHADTDYYLNNSEFLLEGEIEYDVLSGSEIIKDSEDFKLGFDTQVKENIMKAYNSGKKVEKATLPITVSAYAIWRAWATYTVKTVKYTVNATNLATKEKLVAGTFSGYQYSSTKAEYEEKAAPGADGHYSPGHGHDAHGSQANAGGGIIYSE
jgi:hypothetical protein